MQFWASEELRYLTMSAEKMNFSLNDVSTPQFEYKEQLWIDPLEEVWDYPSYDTLCTRSSRQRNVRKIKLLLKTVFRSVFQTVTHVAWLPHWPPDILIIHQDTTVPVRRGAHTRLALSPCRQCYHTQARTDLQPQKFKCGEINIYRCI